MLTQTFFWKVMPEDWLRIINLFFGTRDILSTRNPDDMFRTQQFFFFLGGAFKFSLDA